MTETPRLWMPAPEAAFWADLDERLFRTAYRSLKEEDFDFDAFQSGALADYTGRGANRIVGEAFARLAPCARKHAEVVGRVMGR
jgi:hypothetical protein